MRRRGVRAGPRCCRDRLDHLLHEHVEPVGDARRGTAGQERRRQGSGRQAVGEDVDGARLEGRHGLLREGRPMAVPGEARLPPGRLRLHHLHRQLRPAARRGLRRGQRGRPRRRLGAVGQPELRGPDQPGRQDELPGQPAAGDRLRLAGTMDFDFEAQPLGTTPTAPRCTCATSGPRRRTCRRRSTTRSTRRCSPRTTPTCSPATSAGARCRRPEGETFEWDPESTYVRKPPYFEGMEPRAVAGGGHRRRPGARAARRLGDHRPHLPRRLDQGGHACRAVPRRARRRASGTSTPTAPGAATTR